MQRFVQRGAVSQSRRGKFTEALDYLIKTCTIFKLYLGVISRSDLIASVCNLERTNCVFSCFTARYKSPINLHMSHTSGLTILIEFSI